MVQNPKGGGLSSTFGSSSTLGGVQKTTDFLDKSTWVLATTLIALILLSSLSFTGVLNSDESKMFESAKPATTKTATPAPAKPAPTTTTVPVAPATEKK